MKSKILVSLLLCFFTSQSIANSAKTPDFQCASESDSSSTEIGVVKYRPKFKLIACGHKDGDTVTGLKIVKYDDAVLSTLFEGDQAFKQYKVETGPVNFEVQEALATKGMFEPYIQIHVMCLKGVCAATDKKCLWKKSESKKTTERIAEITPEKCEGVNVLVDDAFKDALNGDKSAVSWFLEGKKDSVSCSAEASESFETYKTDIERLKKLRCL